MGFVHSMSEEFLGCLELALGLQQSPVSHQHMYIVLQLSNKKTNKSKKQTPNEHSTIRREQGAYLKQLCGKLHKLNHPVWKLVEQCLNQRRKLSGMSSIDTTHIEEIWSNA